MDQFTQLFGRLVALVYHCFDRVVILGYLPLLTRPEHMAYFFRGLPCGPPCRGWSGGTALASTSF